MLYAEDFESWWKVCQNVLKSQLLCNKTVAILKKQQKNEC